MMGWSKSKRYPSVRRHQARVGQGWNCVAGGEILEERAVLSADMTTLSAVLGSDLTQMYQRAQVGQPLSQPQGSGSLIVRGDKVLVEVYSRDTVASIGGGLSKAGFQQIATYGRGVSGWLPARNLDALATLQGVNHIRPVYRPVTMQGAAPDQGDEALRAQLARANYGVDGSGITVGILSDSFNVLGGAADGVASGDLPADGVRVLQEGDVLFGTDEGRAMAEIVHAVAPGAKILFATADFGDINFANNIISLAQAGANIIVDDVRYLTDPYFQDGIVAQAAQYVVANGVSFFTSAGNFADESFESDFVNSTVADPDGKGALHAFRPKRNTDDTADTMQKITVPQNGFAEIFLQWDSPTFSAGGVGAFADMALYVMGADGTTVLARSNFNNIGSDPLEALVFFNDGSHDLDGVAGADETFNIAISLKSGFASRIKYMYYGNMQINEYNTRSGTVFGQANAQDVVTVAAAPYYSTSEFGVTPAIAESYTSLGGTEILFDSFGFNTSPGLRAQPTVTGPDGASTTFFGDFFGTSAAAPHIAAVAALMLDAAGGPGSLSPGRVKSELISASQDMVQRFSPTRGVPIGIPTANPSPDPGSAFDFYTGYGFVDANAAVGAVKRYAAIEGIKFSDDNGNGVRDTGEPGIPNFIVYLDINRDGLIGYGEPATLTDANGYYRFTNLDAGTYSVREAPTPGYELTAPLGEVRVTVTLGQFPRVDLANRPRFDYGDAPAPYATSKANNGPRHGIQPGLSLGNSVDSDTGGSVTGSADMDDTTGSDDENGIVFLSELVPGSDAYVQATATIGKNSPAVLQGWIDFDHDGKFDTSGERVIRNQLLVEGPNRLRIQVPTWAITGVTYARFRYAYERDLAPTGPAQAGEVEDYRVIVAPSAGQSILAGNDSYTVNPGSTGNLLDVLANDLTLRGSLSVLLLGAPDHGGTLGISGSFLTYAPAVGFVGTETFNYTVTNGLGSTGQATVTVTVGTPSATLNAADDIFTVTSDSRSNSLNVLLNDLLPSGFTSQITGVGTPSRGGTATIAADGRSLLYTPTAGFSGTETLTYTVSAGNGETDSADVTIVVESGGSAGVQARLRLRATDLDGNAITSIAAGRDFVLRGYVQDLSTDKNGVFAGYADINYPANFVSVNGGISFSANYPNATSGSTAVSGLIDEVGSAADPDLLGSAEILMFSIGMRANAVGSVLFAPDPADVLPRHAWVLFGSNVELTSDQVDLLGTTLIVTAATTNAQNATTAALDVNQDSYISAIDALLVINRLNQAGSDLAQDAGPQVGRYDVNQDGFISAIDALLVINYLNRQSAAAAASTSPAPPPAPSVPAAEVAASQSLTTAARSSRGASEESWDVFAEDVAAARRTT